MNVRHCEICGRYVYAHRKEALCESKKCADRYKLLTEGLADIIILSDMPDECMEAILS